MQDIKMVDLHGQYLKIKDEVDSAIAQVIDTTSFINGPKVKEFTEHLKEYLQVNYVIPCGNGTDALQLALMSLDLEPGDEVIVPAFTYVATAEVIGLLKLTPVLVDVDPENFNIKPEDIEKAVGPRTRAVVPVHLFGQAASMEEILKIAKKYKLYVIEDNAQAIGADYIFADGNRKKTGTIAHIGCTSFFPSKNLGCYGDGGAVFTNDPALGEKLRMLANHGQEKKYIHKYIGVNSRLDTIQAAVLDVKLKYLDQYGQARYNAAQKYSAALASVEQVITPKEMPYSTHVYHQYTIVVKDGKRDELKQFLNDSGIPANIYYPLPLNEQEAFKSISKTPLPLDNTYKLCDSVLSLPMHTELTDEQITFITDKIKEFFKN